MKETRQISWAAVPWYSCTQPSEGCHCQLLCKILSLCLPALAFPWGREKPRCTCSLPFRDRKFINSQWHEWGEARRTPEGRLSWRTERWTWTDCHGGWRGAGLQTAPLLEDLSLLHMLTEGALTISKYKTVLAAEASRKPNPFHSSVCHSRLA